MIELFAVQANKMIDIPVESVEWSGARYSAPRTLRATVLSTNRGLHRLITTEEGDGIVFKWKGQEVFRGTLFRRERNKSGLMILIVYDLLKYLLENSDRYIFINQRADQILSRICKDFQIPIGSIANTGYVIKSLVIKNEQSLYDIVMKALNITYNQTATRYSLYAKDGKIQLVRVRDNIRKWVIEEGVNLIDYSYVTSIEDTITRVKLEAGEEKKTFIATANNGELQKKFGVLQHYEQISEDINPAQLRERANKILEKKGKVSKEFSLEALGISEVFSGTAVLVIEQELGIKKGFYVWEDSHSFKGNEHLMSLTLSETNELPEVE